MIFILIISLFLFSLPALADSKSNGENINVGISATVTNSIDCYENYCVDAQNNVIVPDDFEVSKLVCPPQPELPVGLVIEWQRVNCEILTTKGK